MNIIKHIIVTVSIWFDKFHVGNMLVESGWGRFRVLYNNGEVTSPMSYGSAINYASIFGGKVQHIKSQLIIT